MPEANPYQVKEAHTRFLYPFFFHRDAIREAAGKLQGATLADATGSMDRRAIWQRTEAPGLYRDEVLQHVSEFLFGARVKSRTSAYNQSAIQINLLNV